MRIEHLDETLRGSHLPPLWGRSPWNRECDSTAGGGRLRSIPRSCYSRDSHAKASGALPVTPHPPQHRIRDVAATSPTRGEVGPVVLDSFVKRTLGFAAIMLLTAAGCGKSNASATHPVSGEVIYDGKPAAGVQVFFMPLSGGVKSASGSNPYAVTGPDGRFTLTTIVDGDGAPEGSYQVVLLWPEQSPEEVESPPDRLFGWYDARHTKLTATVTAGPNALPPFKLKAVNGPPPVSEGVPGRN